jgi:gas vesicle protein
MGRKLKTFASLYKGVLLGWLAGTTVGLVYAPRSGVELQTLIRNRVQELKDEANHRLEDARQQAEHLARTSTNRATELTQQGQAIWREQRVSLLSAIQGVRTGVRVFAEQGSAGHPQVGETTAEFNSSTTGTDIQPAPSHDLSTFVQDPDDLI